MSAVASRELLFLANAGTIHVHPLAVDLLFLTLLAYCAHARFQCLTLLQQPGGTLLCALLRAVLGLDHSVTPGPVHNRRISPGAHELGMRYRFEVSGSNIGPGSAPYERNCLIRLNYKEFIAGQRYSLEVGDVGFRAWAKLYDDQRRMVASGRESGCSSGV